jgi:hypothetical protein
LDFYKFSKQNKEHELEENCLAYVAENFESALQEHKQYRDLSLDIFTDILARDDVHCLELDLFNVVLDWGEHTKASDEEIKQALALIRLPIRIS